MTFLAAMGPRPSPLHSLERLNNNKGYEPGNVVWATKKEQSRNREHTIFVEYRGRKLPLVDLAAEVGMAYHLLHHRVVDYGWSVEAAVSAPLKKNQHG